MPKVSGVGHLMRKSIPEHVWGEIQMAFAAGVPLREIARRMGVSEGTVLSRAKRKGWTRQMEDIKAEKQSLAITPLRAVVETLADLGRDSRLKLARGLHKGASHVEQLTGPEVLESAQPILALTKASSAVHGWPNSGTGTAIRLDLLAGTLDVTLDGPVPDQMDIPD
jgi:hypothetical protein